MTIGAQHVDFFAADAKRLTMSMLDQPQADSSVLANEVSSEAPFRVALVAMPFLATNAPSMQLGLLTAIGKTHGFDVSSLHLNLDFARAYSCRQRNMSLTGLAKALDPRIREDDD